MQGEICKVSADLWEPFKGCHDSMSVFDHLISVSQTVQDILSKLLISDSHVNASSSVSY